MLTHTTNENQFKMKHFSLILSFCILILKSGISQSSTYATYGWEMIFSLADIEDQGREESSLLRWSPFFNFNTMLNADMSEHFGIFSGLAIRNVGYIYDNFQQDTVFYKKKFRSYNLGIPLGIKVGNLDNMYLYGGYEIEFPFHYKEKTIEDGDKINKTTGWFSKRQEAFQHGFFVGLQFPHGANIKFKYYLSEFHNQEYEDASGNRPYAGLKTNIFYFSLNYVIRDTRFSEW